MPEIKPLVKEYIKELPHRAKETEFPTTINKLNSKVWLSRSNTNIVAARPSNNKSTFCLNSIAVPTAENGKSVYIFSLEDRKDRYTMRYLANKTSIVNYRIQHNELTESEMLTLEEHENEMENIPLHIIEDVGYKIEDIEKYIKELLIPPDMVIIDYINKIQTKNGNRLETINDYLRGFSALTKTYNFCGIVCCQINREAMGDGNTGKARAPALHHIKESGDIEQICDVAILLHWSYKYSENYMTRNDIEIMVSKNKDGDCGVVHCRIEPEFNRIIGQEVVIAPTKQIVMEEQI